ncbi:MAG: hypothetical protein AB1461_15310 [Thermodesulfobacteriota bacterium]
MNGMDPETKLQETKQVFLNGVHIPIHQKEKTNSALYLAKAIKINALLNNTGASTGNKLGIRIPGQVFSVN